MTCRTELSRRARDCMRSLLGVLWPDRRLQSASLVYDVMLVGLVGMARS